MKKFSFRDNESGAQFSPEQNRLTCYQSSEHAMQGESAHRMTA